MSNPNGRTREQTLIEVLRYFASVPAATRTQAASAVNVDSKTGKWIFHELQYSGKLQGAFTKGAQWSITRKGLIFLNSLREVEQ